MAEERAKRILELRDHAFEVAEHAHGRIRYEQAIYHSTVDNGMYKNNQVHIGKLRPLVAESLDPRITSGINRLVPAFTQSTAPIEVFPEKQADSDDEALLTGSLETWMRTLDIVDSDSDNNRSLIYHNLISGNAICKNYWDHKHFTYRSLAIDPGGFAPDPNGSRIDLTDSMYVCHRTHQTGMHLHLNYKFPEYAPLEDNWRQEFQVDEIWMEKELAEFCGINVESLETPLCRVLIVDDEVKLITSNPFWFPHYPFTCWRNFHLMRPGHAQDFWGFGYGTLLWPQQKLLDEIWANIVYIARRTATGRLMGPKGAIDPNVNTLMSGAYVELNPNFDVSQLKELPTEQIPGALFSIVQLLVDNMSQQIPSNTDAFVGEAPFEGISGKAINSLQQAAYTQLAENITAYNQFRLRQARRKIALIQQFARKPSSPHLWREGVDLPSALPRDARMVAHELKMRDASMFPDTVQGKMQMVQLVLQSGYIISPEKLIEIFGINDVFTTKDLIPPQPQIQPGQGEGGIKPTT